MINEKSYQLQMKTGWVNNEFLKLMRPDERFEWNGIESNRKREIGKIISTIKIIKQEMK